LGDVVTCRIYNEMISRKFLTFSRTRLVCNNHFVKHVVLQNEGSVRTFRSTLLVMCYIFLIPVKFLLDDDILDYSKITAHCVVGYTWEILTKKYSLYHVANCHVDFLLLQKHFQEFLVNYRRKGFKKWFFSHSRLGCRSEKIKRNSGISAKNRTT